MNHDYSRPAGDTLAPDTVMVARESRRSWGVYCPSCLHKILRVPKAPETAGLNDATYRRTCAHCGRRFVLRRVIALVVRLEKDNR